MLKLLYYCVQYRPYHNLAEHRASSYPDLAPPHYRGDLWTQVEIRVPEARSQEKQIAHKRRSVPVLDWIMQVRK